MVDANVAALGLLAGLTIFLGIPVARFGSSSARVRGILNSLSIGILLFLLIEIAVHGFEPVEEAVVAAADGTGGAGDAALMGAVFSVGLAVGLLSLVWFELHFLNRKNSLGQAAADLSPSDRALKLSMMIAVGIGLHNFSEGLAIGASAAAGAMTLAALLAVGFALHNATEGFGIAAPLAGTKPAWRFLLIAGLVAGGPTFIGTLIGSLFSSEPVSVLFLALAAGALIYVIKELLYHGRGAASDPDHAMWVMGALVAGFLIALGTEFILVVAGA
jgi:zinc transporter, ZIP family